MNSGKTIIELHDELKSMKEFVLLEQIRHFNSSIEVFKGNYYQLREYVEFHNNPIKSRELFSVNNREVLFAFQQEIIRLLHNYVASAFSLIDHSRRHYEKLYSNKPEFPEYLIEVKRKFKDVPVANFTKELRQFIQHYDLPAIVSTTKYIASPPSLTQTLLMKKADLIRFDWNSKSLEYLNSNEDDIDLIVLIDSYFRIVEEFYVWFKKAQEKIHSLEIIAVDKKRREIANLAMPDLILATLSFPGCNYEHFEKSISSILSIEEQNEISLKDSELSVRFEAVLNLLKRKFDISIELINRIETIYKN